MNLIMTMVLVGVVDGNDNYFSDGAWTTLHLIHKRSEAADLKLLILKLLILKLLILKLHIVNQSHENPNYVSPKCNKQRYLSHIDRLTLAAGVPYAHDKAM